MKAFIWNTQRKNIRKCSNVSEEIPEQAEVGGMVRDREPVWVVCGVCGGVWV